MLERLAEQGLTIGGAGVWTLVLIFVLALIRLWPVMTRAVADARKTKAEAGLIDAEADDVVATTLERQVQRLDQRVQLLEVEVAECHQDRDLALAAARYLLDRLRAASPSDEAILKLQDYLSQPPIIRVPRSMGSQLDGLA